MGTLVLYRLGPTDPVNDLVRGEVRPALVTLVGENSLGLNVFLVGQADSMSIPLGVTLWRPMVPEGSEPGEWSWPGAHPREKHRDEEEHASPARHEVKKHFFKK